MSTTFRLEIMTPERRFFDDAAEAISFAAPDGERMVLANHAPMLVPLMVGSLQIQQNGAWREAFNSEGFIEVTGKNEVIAYVQACEWPEEIDAHRAEEAERRAEERLRQKQSRAEYHQSKIALARAMARLRVTHTRTGFNG